LLELLEVGERELATEILRTVDPLLKLKTEQPLRFSKLETFCKRPYFSESDAYDMGNSKEKRRHDIADALAIEVSVVQPSRLLALLGQALQFQHTQNLIQPGVSLDLFRGSRRTFKKDVEEKPIKKLTAEFQLTKSSYAESIQFGPDGQHLVTGATNGYIESWDYETFQLRQDLEYQAKGELMVQEGSVLCCAFSRDGDHIATGNQTGQIRIWKLSTGQCLRKFLQAHPQGITSVSFARDGTQILSTSFDQTARIHGLKSGKTLKEFRFFSFFLFLFLIIMIIKIKLLNKNNKK
jgi:WD40 repeat-containing protein SMU1